MRKSDSLRKKNILAVLHLLIARPQSCSMLTKELSLSKTAIREIIEEMLDLGYIILSPFKDDLLVRTGPRDVYYELNNSFCTIGILIFETNSTHLTLVGLNGKIEDEVIFEGTELITLQDLESFANWFNRVIILHQLKIAHLVIAAPGQIARDTGEIKKSQKFRLIPDCHIKDYFQELLDTQVTIHNDINLLLLGEATANYFQNIQDCALIYLDWGIGGAIFNKNRLVVGNEGFAGEFGLVQGINHNHEKTYIDLICSLNAILQHFHNQYTFEQLVGLFQDNDPLVVPFLTFCAHTIADLIHNLYHILNFKTYVIAGRIKQFGLPFRQLIIDKILLEIQTIDIIFSGDDQMSMFIGGLEFGRKQVFEQMLEKEFQ